MVGQIYLCKSITGREEKRSKMIKVGVNKSWEGERKKKKRDGGDSMAGVTE